MLHGCLPVPVLTITGALQDALPTREEQMT